MVYLSWTAGRRASPSHRRRPRPHRHMTRASPTLQLPSPFAATGARRGSSASSRHVSGAKASVAHRAFHDVRPHPSGGSADAWLDLGCGAVDATGPASPEARGRSERRPATPWPLTEGWCRCPATTQSEAEPQRSRRRSAGNRPGSGHGPGRSRLRRQSAFPAGRRAGRTRCTVRAEPSHPPTPAGACCILRRVSRRYDLPGGSCPRHPQVPRLKGIRVSRRSGSGLHEQLRCLFFVRHP